MRRGLSRYACETIGAVQAAGSLYAAWSIVPSIANAGAEAVWTWIDYGRCAFVAVSAVAGVLIAMRRRVGAWLSVAVQAAQILQIAGPAFSFGVLIGPYLLLRLWPEFGPELGIAWRFSVEAGGPEGLVVGINLLPLVLLYFLFDEWNQVVLRGGGRG